MRFDRYKTLDGEVYNLAFGDLDDKTGYINDKAISNNNDRNVILATIAVIVLYFTKKPPASLAFASASTPARTRLYQMGIAKFFREISQLFQVWGLRNDNWENFSINVNYEAFLIRRL